MKGKKKANKKNPTKTTWFLFHFLNVISFQENIYYIQKNQLTCKDFCGIGLRVLYSKGVTPYHLREVQQEINHI